MHRNPHQQPKNKYSCQIHQIYETVKWFYFSVVTTKTLGFHQKSPWQKIQIPLYPKGSVVKIPLFYRLKLLKIPLFLEISSGNSREKQMSLILSMKSQHNFTLKILLKCRFLKLGSKREKFFFQG